MLIKKLFFGVFNFIKRIYILLFSFMIGTETRKFYRVFVHFVTSMLLSLFPYFYFRGIIQLLTGYIEFNMERLTFMIIIVPLMFIASVCLVKLMMYMSNSDDV